MKSKIKVVKVGELTEKGNITATLQIFKGKRIVTAYTLTDPTNPLKEGEEWEENDPKFTTSERDGSSFLWLV